MGDWITYLEKGGEKMKNIELDRESDTLVIRVDLTQTFGPSRTGKTTIIASTEGNVSIPGDENIKIGLNVYKR